MRKYVAILFLSVLVSVLLFSCSGKDDRGSGGERPNIVLIISDDQGWPDFGFMGHEYIQTPNIDRLAEEGMTFSHGYSTAPLCRPSLASIITGLYPHRHGALGNDPVFEAGDVPRYGPEWLMMRAKYNAPVLDAFEKLKTLPDILGDTGYVSLQTGKWWEGNPTTMGGFTRGMTHGDPEHGGRYGDEGKKIGRHGLQVIYDFIDSVRNEDKPFFIWYAPLLPHQPHTAPDSLIQKYLPLAPTKSVAAYWATCEWFDITCGQLIDYIEQKGLGKQTVFVFLADNGWIQDPEHPKKYAPRSKGEPYDMGIRTPIIFRWKGKITPGMNTGSAVSSIDIATTLLELCNLPAAEGMQGIDVLDKQALSNRDAIFAETYAHDFTTVDSGIYYRIIVHLPWKLILPDTVNKPDLSPELYHLVDDPFETNDLSGEYPDTVKVLTAKIRDWWRE